MICPPCGNKLEGSFEICPGCGFKLSALTEKNAQDGATSAHPISTTAEEKNQKKDQDHAVKESTTQIQEQLATGESEPTREDATSSDIITGPAGNSDVNKNHTNTEQNKFTKQTSRKKDKVVKDKKCYSDDQNIHKRQNSTSLSLPTKGTIKKTKPRRKTSKTIKIGLRKMFKKNKKTSPKRTKVADINSDMETDSELTETQDPGNEDVGIYRQTTSPCPSRPQVEENILMTSSKFQIPEDSSVNEVILVCFHAVISKEFHFEPEEDIVVLKSEVLFGSWDAGTAMFPSPLGDNQYLIEGQYRIPKERIQESIPYKYAVRKKENDFIYETIYQKEKNDNYINRCLTITPELLTAEGEWHQYDDMIHPKPKSNWPWNSTEQTVIDGRNFAGWEMLKIIFNLLKTWNDQKVEEFFSLLEQFFFTYSGHLLHDGMERRWGLPYDSKQVKYLLKHFLDKHWSFDAIKETAKIPSLHAGIIGLLVYNKYLKDSMRNQLSSLCSLLCLPKMPKHHFLSFWKDFVKALPYKNRWVADTVETLCHDAMRCSIEKWVLVIPLVHLLRGESKPYEPVPPVLNPQFDSWTGLKRITRTDLYDASHMNLIQIMEEHDYLIDIDHLLVHSWMSLMGVDYLMNDKLIMCVELRDILQCLQFFIRSGNRKHMCMVVRHLTSYLIEKESNHKKSFDDRDGECCLKTAVMLLGSVCCITKDPEFWDLPLQFLDLVCVIARAYGLTDSQTRKIIHEESVKDTLQKMREWQTNTFRNKLLNKQDVLQFSRPSEIQAWSKLLSISFNYEEHTSLWRTTFMDDFQDKLKEEHTVDQIGIYCNKMGEMSKESPLLCSIMENCAMEAAAHICQSKEGERKEGNVRRKYKVRKNQDRSAMSKLLRRYDITKFLKLMSVVVMESWPKDENGHDIQDEDLVFDYLMNWPMAKTILKIAGAGEGLTDKLSDEALSKIDLGRSAFKSVSKKFLSGEIQIKGLLQIFQRKQEFLDFLKIDGLCDDGRCKDESNMKILLRQREVETEAVHYEKQLVKTLLQICQEVPEHVKVDLNGLDKKLQQNFETMNLNEFMKVHTLDGLNSSATANVTYFNLCDETHQMASDIHAIKDSGIFKMCWANQVEVLTRDQSQEGNSDRNREIYTFEQVYNKIFQTCYTNYKRLYVSLKSGELLLEETDSIFKAYKGKYEDLEKDLNIMCRVDPSDDKSWISERVNQIQQYQDIHLALETSKIVMDIKNIICPQGDFSALKKLLQMNESNFKKNNLSYIDDAFLHAKNILKDISDDRKECLQTLIQSKDFIQWTKQELKDINELKVFVDLASISAGENDMDVDRVACLHDAVLGYSSMLYDLKQDSDFAKFNDSLKKLWRALDNDQNIPKKLWDTSRHLEWLKSVRESHGSVEFSSLSLATSVNNKGIYIIKAQDQQQVNVENSLTLQIDDSHKNMTYTYEDLKELQNKLMLMSGKKQQNQSEVERFTEVFDNVQRFTKAFVDIYTAGNPIFRCWEAKIYCKTQSDPCIIMEIKFCKTQYCFKVTGSLAEQLVALSKKMEMFLDDWQKFMDEQRTDQYYLNYFTAQQIFYLCSILTPTNINTEIEDRALMMLSFIKPNCTTLDVRSIWRHNQYELRKRYNEHRDSSSHSVIHFAHESDAADEADQTLVLKELEELWNGYMKNEEIFFHDLLDIRSLGRLLQLMTDNPNHNEWEAEPELSETRDCSLRREFPKGLNSKQPNLIICPHDEVLTSSICLYMNDYYGSLPTYDEVLLCSPSTSYEQVELFLRRCLTPGDIGRKIYTMLWADQLSYDVSCAMEKCFQKLCSPKNDYRLVIFCSSDREHTYIPTAFSQYKTDFVPQEPLEKIQQYLSQHYTVTSDYKNAVFKGGHSLGIVASSRAGVGKSLYVQRLYEKLERSVDQGIAFKKCIRLTEHEVDDHKILQFLYDTPKQKDIKVFHFDVTSSVQKGLNEFIFKLFFLRYLMDSNGQMWQCSQNHLYVIELLESTNDQNRCDTRLGRNENFAFSDVFPKLFCHPPKKVMALEMQKEENPDMDCGDPLMDDECFTSEAYQRPYQYLTRFHNKDNLDNFTFQGTEGTHAKCLQILLIYCGIIDPSWAELRNFVWFLNLQLKDCENSDFCKVELVGDTLCGFKNFVVEFMILMSKDFATPSLCITDQSPGRQHVDISGLKEKDLAPFLIRKRWESEPHPYIFFNDDHMSMTFIGFHLRPNNQKGFDAVNPLTKEVIKKNIMTRQLYNGLKLQRVPFNTDFDQLPRADKIEHLCSVLGVKWPTDPDETYELTTDNILKMMAIHMRFRCDIPVIIMGETGCGKTRLIKFMCELRRCGAPAENMKLVKIHGGTTSEMIYEKVKEAETLARTNKENHELDSVLFFDEANTTEAVNSIKEILCDNSVQGEELGSNTGLYIIAACNPYRKHTDQMIKRLEASGLGYRVRAEETEDRLGSIPLRQLVYRVHVLPPSMIPLVWDFGQLNDSTEQIYIEQIVQRQVKASFIEKDCIPTIIKVLSSSQKFMRERKDECSFVSLRDVERCMQGFLWFYNNHPMFAENLKDLFQQQQKNNPPFSPASDRVLWSLLMATGMCYQSCLENKEQYQKTISQIFPDEYTLQRVLQEMELMQDLLLNRVPMGETIARNEALKENFFMMVVCIELRIPLFIVGKPGSSKSLSKTLVANAMQGPTSHSDLYKKLKQIHLVSFQCSPHSTPEGIINTFKQCARFQESKNLDEYISVVVLDEIGLAEDSPKMPLKALHPLLEEGCVDDEPKPHKRVGFIGISNWALDPAKMNRGIFVSRGDLNEQELIKSARGICSSDQHVLEKIKNLFQPFAKAYMTVCDKSKGFFGLRDFYSLIKMLFSITKTSNEPPAADQITGAVLRNFSGKDDVDVINTFRKELRDDFANVRIPTIDLVKQSISPASQMEESRYLLVLTKNYAALQILQQIFCSHQICPEIIFGSSFPKDQEYTQICRNINRVKVCMETGQTVVLLNLQNLYESLYDALNQYYVTLGGQNYVDLGLGTHRVKCRVHQNFKLIVIEEKEVVYEQFPIPLINRLEKHYLDIKTVLTEEQKVIATQLEEWVNKFVSSEKKYDPSDVFIGYHSDTCSSVVMQVTECESTETDAQVTLNKAKDILLNCATPDSVVRLDKSKLPNAEREHLMQEYVKEARHSSLGDYIVYHIQQPQQSHFLFTEVTTFSRLLTAVDTQHLQSLINLDAVQLLSLQQFDTQYSFLKKIRDFLGSTHTDKVLIIQAEYDEGFHKKNIISSAKYACFSEVNKCHTTDDIKTFVYFVIKLPRMEGGTSYVGFQGGPWRSVHIDDIRRSKEFLSDALSLKNRLISDLFKDPSEAVEKEDSTGVPQKYDSTALECLFDTTNLVRSCVQSAVSMLRDEANSGEFSTKRVENLLTLLDGNHTQGLFAKIVRKRLHSLLKDNEANMPILKSWVLNEASNDSALQEGGTFLHTLWRKIQAVVTPLLAYLVSVIDRDCNMDLLLEDEEQIVNLWLEIFGNKEMLSLPYVRVEKKVFMVQSHVTGGHTMFCRLPFSWWIKEFLDGLMMEASRHQIGHFYDLFLETPLGTYISEKANEKMKREFFKRYLQDFVSMTMKVASDEELQLLCQAMASCADEVRKRKQDNELFLPLIHIAYRFYQNRLQNLARMISLHPEVISPLQKNPVISGYPSMVLDVYAAKACVESLEPSNLENDTVCQRWLRKVKKVQASLELICSQSSSKKYGEHCRKVLHDFSNGWKRIHILSFFVEHMLLGFQNEDRQLRTHVLNTIKTLSNVLQENSDVKSTKGFEAVVKVLKSCKQEATNQLFRFGLECGVCMREPQETVGLPCNHIYCLTCIKNSLDAGRTSCPKCRQQLPDDFQPHVSEDISASVKKNAEFRRCCNGFFVDLLSAVCFKDNTPPAEGVITHLLSYLMIETEHKQIHTKVLSPFEESPDKNPVVRSVILKLLLKFSFDEVQKYLQQHFSSVEESRFVDDGDRAELYALYINCLEDSIWEKMPLEGNKAAELQFFTNETQFLRLFLEEDASAPATVCIQHLQHIARLRVTLTMAAKLISDRLPGNNVPDRAEDFLNMVIKLCEDSGNDWYRVYLIRKLSESQGVEYVQTMMKNPEFFWIFPEEIHQQNEDGGLMDQYLVYGEEYKSVRKAVAKAVVDGDVEQIEDSCERCTASPKNRTVFLLLALFREVTTLYRSENGGLHPTPEQCIKFDDLIEGSTYLHQAEVRRFASALVYNRLGALTVQPGSAIMENTITELIIHLAAVLLTGNHHLLMPQKHLGLSPENMQRAFIPTMPDDMLAVAQAAIQQQETHYQGRLTWYVCPNNHPCCVGMCGRPMERGRCLECGEEVGGEHHIALPGFTQVPLHEDQTRPGHILGDPERRNNPDALDTKHMSLTPFTLVRLVTHLAMMLGASEKPEVVQQIIQPPVEDVSLFLRLHIIKDLEQLSQALGKGADDNITSVHLVLKSLQELPRASSTTIDPYLTTKESRNTWETTVVTDIMTPKLKDLDQVLQEANGNIRNDSRVSSNFIIRTIHGDDCSFLASLQQCSEVDSSAVWSCRERLSLLSLTHIMETNDQKEELPLLWRFLQKEREFRLIKFLPEILNLQKRLVRKYQNATEDIVGSIREFIDQQKEMRQWYQKHIETFLKTWNQLRVSVTSNEIKIPEEFCSRDLDLDSDLRYLLPRRQGPGLCATGLVSYLVTLHNELVNAVDHHTREDSSDYTVSLTELTEQHVISYDVEKDLLPLILSNCQYSLECGHETISEYDLPRIQQQILTRFLQGKPLITRAGIPTLVNMQERDYETIFKTVHGKVPQRALSRLIWNSVSRQLDSYSEVCEALKIVELLLGYLSMTGGDPTMKLVTYLQEILKMDQNINQHILKAFGKCDLKHCVCLWQVLSSLRSEKMLQLKREPFSGYPAEYQVPLTEENKTELKRFMSRGNVDQWLLEMHEFLLLRLGRLRATEDYNPSWSLKEAVSAYMDRKEVEVALYVEENFSENVLLSQIIETWKYTITAKQELMNE
ncbi:E3 ubiquitin-protein ligase rnf213-alpha isoform X1 [Oreochromis niloticus]|uniref:E3 ubiquitin-protein ligase rnf213-alpha isoform X1 n=1 Tax=Oreochromis niloticus TaxID=8128 RepID=UPI00090509BE|nr:E3 ubiquitin-protein ligase rnf213-alpha isoform X1 [Oreochromis niloticus]